MSDNFKWDVKSAEFGYDVAKSVIAVTKLGNSISAMMNAAIAADIQLNRLAIAHLQAENAELKAKLVSFDARLSLLETDGK